MAALKPDIGLLRRIQARRPLVHCVSNIVTAADCANLALAVGASPMMASAPEEMEEITLLADSTVLNTGTPDRDRFAACRVCGETALRLGRPVVLDPVGAGASVWRLRELEKLLEAFTPAILRVNLAEALALCHSSEKEHGVDSDKEASLSQRLKTARRLAEQYRCAVLLTGEEDIAADCARAYRIPGGSGQMRRLTGAGCMLSVLCGVFAAAEPDPLAAAAFAGAFWKACAYLAELSAGPGRPGRFHTALFDAAGGMDSRVFADNAIITEIPSV